MDKSAQKYFDRHAEPETQQVNELPGKFEHVLVIPAFDEKIQLLDELESLAKRNLKILIVLVANCPERNPLHTSTDEPPPELHQAAILRTEAFARTIRTRLPLLWTAPGKTRITLHALDAKDSTPVQPSPPSPSALLLIDRCEAGHRINPKEGVGLARKMGADIASFLIEKGNINSSWIHNSDGDVRFPADYFKIQGDAGDAALIYPYRHFCPPESKLGIPHLLYEISLHYYVRGLAWANSPYAFQTVGSTLAIQSRHYINVRGFPKRSAGEDFYLLNKLAKVGHIRSLTHPIIEIEGRESSRVPFGTGAAIGKIIKLEQPHQDYTYYDPILFHYLKIWIQGINDLWSGQDQFQSLGLENWLTRIVETENLDAVDTNLLTHVLSTLKASEAITIALNQHRSQDAFLRHMHSWFDGFRTLRFLHLLRENKYPSQPLANILGQIPFWKTPRADELVLTEGGLKQLLTDVRNSFSGEL